MNDFNTLNSTIEAIGTQTRQGLTALNNGHIQLAEKAFTDINLEVKLLEKRIFELEQSINDSLKSIEKTLSIPKQKKPSYSDEVMLGE
jgi:hypothetical protein